MHTVAQHTRRVLRRCVPRLAAHTQQTRYSREDGYAEHAAQATSTMDALLSGAGHGAREAGLLHLETDRDCARHLRRKFRHSKLMTATPAKVAGDRSKLRVFVRMLKEFETMKHLGCPVGPRSYAVAIAVANSVMTVIRDTPQQQHQLLQVAVNLFDEFKHRRIPASTTETGWVYAAIMHAYIKAGRPETALAVAYNDMKAERIPLQTEHYSLILSALGRMKNEPAAWEVLERIDAKILGGAEGLHLLRAMLAACWRYKSGKRAVLKFARWGTGLDVHAARGLVACCLREVGVALWGLFPHELAAVTAEEKTALAANAADAHAYIVRVGIVFDSTLEASFMQVYAVAGRYADVVAVFSRLRVPPCFYCYSTLISAAAQASRDRDASRDWVRLAEAAFWKAEVSGTNSRSGVMYECLIDVYAAVGAKAKAAQLVQYMQQTATRLKVSSRLQQKLWEMGLKAEAEAARVRQYESEGGTDPLNDPAENHDDPIF